MKVSVNTLRFINQHYQSAGDPAPEGVDALVAKIGAQLGGVEEVVDFGSKYEGVLIVKVVSCVKHEDSDHLNVCLIDDGGAAKDVERNGEGLVQVVCGAPNVHADMLAVWLPPGSTVPESVGKEPFVLSARPLRGVVSNGMLASPRELALGDSHEGILEVALDSDEQIIPGTAFAEAYHLRDDVVIDIENKMFTHRPDCFGYLGVAREIEGISGRQYKSPEWYRTDVTLPAPEAEQLPIEFRNELPELVQRFSAIVMRDVEVKPSPLWLQIDLAKNGVRSINNIVDYTNFFMLETGQPLHAYDYDKLKALDQSDKATIVVRHPQAGEKIALLNGKEIEPRSEAIMIASASKLIGVGGVMGGSETEVDENTRNIVIEAANFDMYSIRRTSMAHGLFTDAVSRFNKGQSPLQTKTVIAKIVDEIRLFANGKVASELVDDIHVASEVLERNSLHTPVQVDVEFVNVRLGLQLSAEEMRQLLTNVEFDVTVEGGSLTVKAPFWRTDIEIPEDIVEEIGRLYGFDRLPLELPKRRITPTAKDALAELKGAVRSCLVAAGANELLTYSFVHGNLLDKVGQDKTKAYQVSNALSPDLQYYRLSLTPSLLEKVHPNIKAGHDEFALFEIGKAHVKGQVDQEGLPLEFERVAAVYAASDKQTAKRPGAAYYQARLYLESLLAGLRISGDVTYEPLDSQEDDQSVVFYEPGRAATVRLDGEVLGRIGEYRAAVRKALKLPDYVAGFELGLGRLLAAKGSGANYVPLSKYPIVEQDITLRVPAGMLYGQLADFMSQALTKAVENEEQGSSAMRFWVKPVDIYQPQEDAAHKHITFRLTIASYEKTLRDSEVSAILGRAAADAHDQFGAAVV